jgi:hypothetical protein
LWLVLVAYLPAIKNAWQTVGVYLIDAVRQEAEVEKLEEIKIQKHLHRKNAKICQTFIDTRDSRTRKLKTGKLWSDVLTNIVEDGFAEDEEPDQMGEFKEVVTRVLDNSVPTFSSVIKITKIQRAYTRWSQYRKQAVKNGKPLWRTFDADGKSQFTICSEGGMVVPASVGLMREFVRGAVMDSRVSVHLAVAPPAGVPDIQHVARQLGMVFGDSDGIAPPWLEADGSYVCQLLTDVET